jgi:hypothetical protein
MKNTIPNPKVELEYALSDFSDYTHSAFLVSALHWAEQHGFWQPFVRLLSVPMKRVVYTPVQKVQTLMASIMIGCKYNKDVNFRLVPDEVAASALGMARFPDQSQLNLLLRRMDETNLLELQAIHAEHLRQYERFSPSAEAEAEGRDYLLVDIDQCGLIANGKTYELSRKGYFPHRRGERGYQMSAAWLGSSATTLGLRLDPGNTHCSVHFREMVELSEARCYTSGVRRKMVFRVDGGYGARRNGTQPQIRWMVAQGRLFVAKAATTRPRKWAAKVMPQNWQRVGEGAQGVRVAEVEGGPYVRAIVCEVTPPGVEGRVEYSVLLTNLSGQEFDAEALWHLYAGRQTIEAFFKTGRTVYGLGNLRSRNFSAIYAFVWLVFITHNLLQWVRQSLFGGTPLEGIGTRELVERIGRIPAWRQRTERGWRLHLPAQDALARLFVQALCPHWVQIPLRLYET